MATDEYKMGHDNKALFKVSIYEILRETGFMKMPSERTLSDYSSIAHIAVAEILKGQMAT